MPASTGSVSVGTSATLILSADSDRKRFYIVNNSDAETLYLGVDSSVTASGDTSNDGLPLYPNQARHDVFVSEGYKGDVYGIATGTSNVRFWQET